jgi:hypothetical protein
MNKMPLVLSMLLFSTLSWATDITTKIDKVLLYVNSAHITRSASVTIKKGKNEMLLTQLPLSLDKNSLQLKLPPIYKIAKINISRTVVDNSIQKNKLQEIEVSKKLLLRKMEFQQSLIRVCQEEEKVILKNQQLSNNTSYPKAIDIKELADLNRTRLQEIYLKQYELANTINALDSAIQQKDKDAYTITKLPIKLYTQIAIEFESSKDAVEKIEVSYLIAKAGWYATYDFNVQEINKPVTLSLNANVFNQTGEDWNDIKLAVSNTNPTEEKRPPSISPWYIGNNSPPQVNVKRINNYLLNNNINQISGIIADNNGEPIPSAKILIDGTCIGTTANENGEFSLQVNALAQSLTIYHPLYQIKTLAISEEIGTINLEPIDQSQPYYSISYRKPILIADYTSSVTRNLNMQALEKKNKAAAIIHDVTQNSTPQFVDGAISASSPQTYSWAAMDLAIPNVNLTAGFNGTYEVIQQNDAYYVPDVNRDIAIELPIQYTVPSTGLVTTINIKNDDIVADYQYYSVPKLDNKVYLIAMLPRWQEKNLIDGEMNLFLEGKFIGKTAINTHLKIDTLTIFLGAEKQIVIDRTTITNKAKSKFWADKIAEQKEFEIVVKNNCKHGVSLKIVDQFPISNHEKISIENEQATDAIINSITKVATWNFVLNTLEQKRMKLSYTITHPTSIKLVSE